MRRDTTTERGLTMCRYDDDFSWMVMSTDPAHVGDADVACEDCGRIIPAGEPHTFYVGDASGGEEDDRPHVYVYFPHAPHEPPYDDEDCEGKVWVIVPEDNLPEIEALGIECGEIRHPGLRNDNISHHDQCAQCYEANHWLEKVCHQHNVLVTREDLREHADEYEPDTLGRHFLAMDRACGSGWKHRRGRPMSPAVVRRLARHAVRHAQLVGMHP